VICRARGREENGFFFFFFFSRCRKRFTSTNLVLGIFQPHGRVCTRQPEIYITVTFSIKVLGLLILLVSDWNQITIQVGINLFNPSIAAWKFICDQLTSLFLHRPCEWLCLNFAAISSLRFIRKGTCVRFSYRVSGENGGIRFFERNVRVIQTKTLSSMNSLDYAKSYSK